MKKRFDSLDILRGITITFMCIVNNPGSWGHMYAPLEHAEWIGCTPTDLVYPFFIFCMGCAMAFSYSRFESFSKDACLKLVKRSIGIFLIGILIALYPFFPTSLHDPDWTLWQNVGYWLGHKRIFGVLQRIACAYLIGGMLALWLRKPGKILGAVAILLVTYTAILVIFGSDPGPFTLEGNISRRIDVALLGDSHVYHGYHYADGSAAAFDPEGPLGSLPAAASCLLAYLIGNLIITATRRHSENPLDDASSPMAIVCKVFALGMVSLGIGEILSIWIPISKPLWSASYVFYTTGWASLALAFLMYCADIRGIRKPFKPFKIMGLNAMAAFVLSGVFAKSYQFVNWVPSRYFGANEFMSLVYSIIFAGVIFACLYGLYKKNIIIKV